MVVQSTQPERLVFVDEAKLWVPTPRLPRSTYSPKGERAYSSVPRNRGPNTTLLSSMTQHGMGPSEALAVVGATTKVVFESYMERVLAPSLEDGQIVVLDNLVAHKSEKVTELVQARGCELLYLPPYSPDLNPASLEEAFSKVKGILRKAGARTREAVIKALRAASSAVTLGDARGYFEHGGYSSTVHPL